jgi:hypothetical protein
MIQCTAKVCRIVDADIVQLGRLASPGEHLLGLAVGEGVGKHGRPGAARLGGSVSRNLLGELVRDRYVPRSARGLESARPALHGKSPLGETHIAPYDGVAASTAYQPTLAPLWPSEPAHSPQSCSGQLEFVRRQEPLDVQLPDSTEYQAGKARAVPGAGRGTIASA